jgi:hypothetical protein
MRGKHDLRMALRSVDTMTPRDVELGQKWRNIVTEATQREAVWEVTSIEESHVNLESDRGWERVAFGALLAYWAPAE